MSRIGKIMENLKSLIKSVDREYYQNIPPLRRCELVTEERHEKPEYCTHGRKRNCGRNKSNKVNHDKN